MKNAPADPFDRCAITAAQRYARCVEASRRVRWDIDRDVLRGRNLEFDRKFMPDELSKLGELAFLWPDEKRLLSQIQGRTYANMLVVFERFIGAKTLEVSRDHWFGDQVALEALVSLVDEELKHQALFRRLEAFAAEGMPTGYVFRPEPNEIAAQVLGRSTWAVLGLTFDIELISQAHYRSSIEPDPNLSGLWKDVLLFHWKEEAQHAVLDELEWRREHARLDDAGRDRGVAELIELLGAIDTMLRLQAAADADYFLRCARRPFAPSDEEAIGDAVLRAYRWQYIAGGMQEPRFIAVLKALTTPQQFARIGAALAPIVAHASA